MNYNLQGALGQAGHVKKELVDGDIPIDEVGKRHWRSVAVQVVSEAENCHGAEFLLHAAVRVRVPDRLLVPDKWLRVMQKA